MESWFDELAKSLAGDVSRREVLRRLGGGLAGALLASLGLEKVWGQGNSACAHWCNSIYPPGPLRGKCKDDASQGVGRCYECGPGADQLGLAHGPICGSSTNRFCCAAGQVCQGGECAGGSPGPCPTPTNYSVSFGDQVVGTASSPLTCGVLGPGSGCFGVVNPSSHTSIVSTQLTGANAGDFVITDNSCNGTEAPGASCYVSISFAPTAHGTRTATLGVWGDGCLQITWQLTGNGVDGGGIGGVTK